MYRFLLLSLLVYNSRSYLYSNLRKRRGPWFNIKSIKVLPPNNQNNHNCPWPTYNYSKYNSSNSINNS